MPLGSRQDFGDTRFAGILIPFHQNIEDAVNVRMGIIVIGCLAWREVLQSVFVVVL